MRIVILINPKLPVEHFQESSKYAEASIGFDLPMKTVEDHVTLARGLRDAAEVLEAPTVPDKEMT